MITNFQGLEREDFTYAMAHAGDCPCYACDRLVDFRDETSTYVAFSRFLSHARRPPAFLPSPTPGGIVFLRFLQFSFLLGTDTYQDLRKGKWRNSKELLDTLNFVIVDREFCFPVTVFCFSGKVSRR